MASRRAALRDTSDTDSADTSGMDLADTSGMDLADTSDTVAAEMLGMDWVARAGLYRRASALVVAGTSGMDRVDMSGTDTAGTWDRASKSASAKARSASDTADRSGKEPVYKLAWV